MGRVAQQETWPSYLGVGDFTCLREVGFEPVGQVMGSIVHGPGWWHTGRVYCGIMPDRGRANDQPPWSRGAELRAAGLRAGVKDAEFGTYTDNVWARRRHAMKQMEAECAALGGDGVVGLRVTTGPFSADTTLTSFQAFGTAVRAIGEVRAPRPFMSHLTGQDFAKLITSGWVPVDIALGAAVAVRHDFWQPATSRSAPPQEIERWTSLVSKARGHARKRLLQNLRQVRADGVVVSSTDLQVHKRECSVHDGHDHVVETSIIGTAIARFRQSGPPPATLTIMRLT